MNQESTIDTSSGHSHVPEWEVGRMNTMTSSQTNTFLQTLSSEHVEISKRIFDLRRFWSEVNELGYGPKYEEMGARVRELRDFLANHFAHEEEDGFLAYALKRAPHLTEQAEHLKRQHQQILDSLDTYTSRLQACEQSYQCWRDVLMDIEQFLNLLHEHESTEAAIIVETLDVEDDPQN
jgi:hypothetical protein